MKDFWWGKNGRDNVGVKLSNSSLCISIRAQVLFCLAQTFCSDVEGCSVRSEAEGRVSDMEMETKMEQTSAQEVI